jgi:hypothetical protein
MEWRHNYQYCMIVIIQIWIWPQLRPPYFGDDWNHSKILKCIFSDYLYIPNLDFTFWDIINLQLWWLGYTLRILYMYIRIWQNYLLQKYICYSCVT